MELQELIDRIEKWKLRTAGETMDESGEPVDGEPDTVDISATDLAGIVEADMEAPADVDVDGDALEVMDDTLEDEADSVAEDSEETLEEMPAFDDEDEAAEGDEADAQDDEAEADDESVAQQVLDDELEAAAEVDDTDTDEVESR